MNLKKGCIEQCPGCHHRQMSYEESLHIKERWLKAKLKPWENCFGEVQSVIESGRWGYRNKTCLHTRYQSGKWEFGMIHRDEFIAIPDCPVHNEKVRIVMKLLSEILPSGKLFPMAYFVQVNHQVSLILKDKKMPELSWVTDSFEKSMKQYGVKGFSIHLNPSAGRRMFEKTPWKLVFGDPYSKDEKGLFYSRTSFQQLIPELHMRSIEEAEDFLNPQPGDKVIDLYCGNGTSLVRWLNRGAKTIGIETGADSVECARANAPDAHILRGTCEQRLPQVKDWLQENYLPDKYVMLYANPPRTGIEPKVLEFIVHEARPVRMAYLSCSAGTLRRDLDYLTNNNYKVARITPYDFFPQTHHVECLVLLEDISGQL